MGTKIKKCYIFCGGEINNYSFLNIEEIKNNFIICADGGYLHCKKLNIIPNIVLGDFDTLDKRLISNSDVIVYPSEKDDTDSMIAVKTALEKGYSQIILIGALGGRLDHTIANIQSLVYISEHDAHGYILGENEFVTVLSDNFNEFTIDYKYKYFSAFSLSDKTYGVTTNNLKYYLENATLSNSFPLGISNEITQNPGKIKISSGKLLIICTNDMNQ